jgi:broad specificity phosphatase PhoE
MTDPVTELYLVRHGESLWNAERRVQGQKDPGLSPRGRQQAQRLADVLARIPLELAYSSPASRALETARIALGNRLPVEVVPELIEIDLGVWEGRRSEEVREQDPLNFMLWFQRPTRARIAGAELLVDFRERVRRAFDGILRKNEGRRVVVFTHGGVLCVFFTVLLGMRLDHLWRFKLRNASLSKVIASGPWRRIEVLGDVHHLEGLPPTLPPEERVLP